MTRSRPAGLHWGVFVLLAAILAMGLFLVWYSTVWGAGLISDSYQYTASARNLARGNGFSLPVGGGAFEPMTKYPPMFSILLSVFELAGFSSLQAARFVNMALFGANIFLVFLSTQRLAHSFFFSLLAAVFFCLSPVMVEDHSWALSEPLYICFGLVSILLVQKYFENDKNTWLILAGVTAALAFLTRYVGISLVLAIGMILLLDKAGFRKRLRDLFMFGLIAILPMALWTLRGYLLTQTLNDRMIAFHPLTLKNYVSAIDVFYSWFFPSSLVQGAEKYFLALTAIVLVVFFILLWRFNQAPVRGLVEDFTPEKRILLLHSLYIVLYGMVVIASKMWIDPDIGLSDRILSPMLVSMLILLSVFLAYMWSRYGKARPVVVLIALGLIAYYSAGTFVNVRQFHETGIGIARRGWHRSEVIQSLRSYSSYPIYTNSNSSLYLWSDRAGYSIPEFELLKEKGTDDKALLVIFHHVPPKGSRLEKLTGGLEVLAEDQVASVYLLTP